MEETLRTAIVEDEDAAAQGGLFPVQHLLSHQPAACPAAHRRHRGGGGPGAAGEPGQEKGAHGGSDRLPGQGSVTQ